MTPEEIQLEIEKIGTYISQSKNKEAKELALHLLTVSEVKDSPNNVAFILNKLGNVYFNLSEFSKAIEYFHQALVINEEIGNKNGIAANLGNIGNVYQNLSEYSKAIEYHQQALVIYEEIGNKQGIASNLGNIGIVYHNLSEYSKAIEYYQKSLVINEEIGNKSGIANNLGNIGNVYKNLSEYSKAIEYYQQSLVINEEIGNKEGIARNLGNIGNVYFDLSENSKAIEYHQQSLVINEEIGNKNGIATNLGNIGGTYIDFYDFEKANEFLCKSKQIAEEIEAKEILFNLDLSFSKLSEKQGNFQSALEYYKKYIELKDEILSEVTKKKAVQFDQARKLEEDEKARQLKLARFQEQEKLLYNILPIKIANRILKQETFIADHFESVSVLFMDLVGFTPLSSIAPPKQLVYLLDTIFAKADEIVESNGLEKIKTIGDGYMAVANVTTTLENHQFATAKAAIELIETMKDLVVTFPEELGSTEWTKDMNDIEIRIGIHTGEVVAGVIGKNKFTFDLWGDAVNVSSRMESHSEPWKIHISEKFANSISQYPEFKLMPRGEINIKGKGNMQTYWLEKANFSTKE